MMLIGRFQFVYVATTHQNGTVREKLSMVLPAGFNYQGIALTWKWSTGNWIVRLPVDYTISLTVLAYQFAHTAFM